MGLELRSKATNQKAEVAGVWMEYDDGAELLIARHMNKEHERFWTKNYKKNRRKFERGDHSADQLAERVEAEGLAYHVLKGWKNVSIDGKDTSYTPELGIKMMLEIPDFRKDIEELAKDVDQFRADSLEDDIDNLKK